MNNNVVSSSKNSFREALNILIGFFIKSEYKIFSEIGTVKAVSLKNSYCDVVFEDKKEVRCWLQSSTAKGLLITPKVDSKVIVTFMSKTNAVVTSYGEVDTFYLFYDAEKEKAIAKTTLEDIVFFEDDNDKSTTKFTVDNVVFFEGKNGGLVKIDALISQLEDIKTDLDTIKNMFLTGTPTALLSPAGNVSGTLGINVVIKTLSPVKSDFEDGNVKH